MIISKKFYKSFFCLLLLIVLTLFIYNKDIGKNNFELIKTDFTDLPGWQSTDIFPALQSFKQSCKYILSEEFIEEDNAGQQILQQVRYKEPQELNSEVITIEIKALNKITAKTSTLSIKLGEEKYFGNLKIKPLKCKASDIDQPPDIVAYLQVIDISDKKNDQVFVFNGWTFASSPTLRSLDHAIYDLWLLGCSNI